MAISLAVGLEGRRIDGDLLGFTRRPGAVMSDKTKSPGYFCPWRFWFVRLDETIKPSAR